MKILVLAALCLTVPAAAAAGSDVADTKPDGAKKLCRRVMVTGSIMQHRVCRTAAEWNAQGLASEAAFESARYSRNRSWTKSLGEQ